MRKRLLLSFFKKVTEGRGKLGHQNLRINKDIKTKEQIKSLCNLFVLLFLCLNPFSYL